MSTDNQISMRSRRMGQITAALLFLQQAEGDCDVLLNYVSIGELDPKKTPHLAERARSKLSMLRERVCNVIRVIDMVDETLKNPGNGG